MVFLFMAKEPFSPDVFLSVSVADNSIISPGKKNVLSFSPSHSPIPCCLKESGEAGGEREKENEYQFSIVFL